MPHPSPHLEIGVLPVEHASVGAGSLILRALSPHIRVVDLGTAPDLEIDGIVRKEGASPPVAFQALPAITWEALTEEEARDQFFEQALGVRRLRRLFHPSWSLAELMAFNTRERHRLIAHDPKRHRFIGRLVSKAKDHPREELEREIRSLYLESLAKPVTRRKHANVLTNIAEILDGGVSETERQSIGQSLESFSSGQTPLWPVLVRLREEAARQGLIGLAAQSYLDPDPLERRIRFAADDPPASATE